MPSWVVKLIQALAVPVLNWIGTAIKDAINSYRSNQERRTLDEKQKKRANLVRQIEIAKEKGDIEEIKRLSIALHLLDSEL